jgi:SagB-type dehydrogenase family enzyme
MPELDLAWRLADRDAHALPDGTSLFITFGDGTRLRLDLPATDLAEVLARVATPMGLPERLVVGTPDGARMMAALERLQLTNRLEWLATVEARDYAVLVPLSHRFAPVEGPAVGRNVDRFAYLRRDAGCAVLDSPEAACRIVLSPAAAAAVARLMAGESTAADQPAACLLGRAGFLAPHEDPPARQLWSFHDRLFHAATRPANEAMRFGPTGRLKGVMPPPEPVWAEGVPARPTMPAAASAPLHRLMEERRSIRDFAARPPCRSQLEALFSRTLRITARRRAGAANWLERPVPAAGGVGEIVGYVAVRAVEGMAEGLWRHDALADRLDQVASPVLLLHRFFEMVAGFMQRPGAPPPAVAVLAARLPEMAWKYEAIAYRLALLDAGAALGILHLVAQDVGLGACAIGTVNPRSLAALTGTDGFAEVSMVEMALGRP